MWQYPATALDRLADMISGRAVEDTPTTNLFAWVMVKKRGKLIGITDGDEGTRSKGKKRDNDKNKEMRKDRGEGEE